MQWPAETTAWIRERVAAQTGRAFEGEVTPYQGEGLQIDRSGACAQVTACDKAALARAFFLMAQSQARGEAEQHVSQARGFASCGAFWDCSRGAVLTVEGGKRLLDALAALGLNLLVLYMEDTYEIPEYPYFGHLRGRYTKEELSELDAYADALGIELVPCIQTLAHLGQFLQWKENESLKDTPYCLLADEEETYAFLEASLAAMRGCVRGRRIHIGMDEAHGVGLGRYYAKHGPVDRFELLRRHLDRVVTLCRRYGFEPMMWSDMFFRLGSKTGDYYDLEAHIPQDVLDSLPDVDLVYWDYYHTEPDFYDHMLSEHAKMGKHTAFAGGIWTWSGFLPQVELTQATLLPALSACSRHRVQTVMATLWGDDGNETDGFLALSQFPLLSEFCWRGEGCPLREVEEAGAFLTGLPAEAYRAFADFYAGPVDDRTGKGLIYCDPLYPLLPGAPDLSACASRYDRARAALAPHVSRADCAYADALFDIAGRKARLIPEIRRLYQAGDRPGLKALADRDIPPLLEAYDRLLALHRSQWEASYKRNGWEIFALRYGAVTGRLRDVRHALLRYAAGELETLCELDEPALEASRRANMQWYQIYVSPQM